MIEPVERYDVNLPGDSAPLKTFLRRFGKREAGAPAVVMLHGGNTSGDTFLAPDGGLAAFLVERGFDVWILEWRSSPHVLGRLAREGLPPLGGSVPAECKLFTLDHVVDEELPLALDIVRPKIKDAELSLLGHCFGSAAVSIAVARGKLERFDVRNLVLSTLGLFVEVPWNGWLKAEDFIMERVLHNDPGCRWIDPHDFGSWASDMKIAMEHWPAAWLPSGGTPPEDLLRRLAFMFGQPYAIDRLDPSLRGDAVKAYFGPMHVGLFTHASQMVRRGFAAPFDAPDVIDRPRLVGTGAAAARAFDGDLDPTHFRNKRVTLLAAGENHLWHRESVDLMYDWLRSIAGPPPSRYAKHVFPGYNLQELMWGVRAKQQVFPAVEEGLGSQSRRLRPPPVAGMAAFGLPAAPPSSLEAPPRVR